MTPYAAAAAGATASTSASGTNCCTPGASVGAAVDAVSEVFGPDLYGQADRDQLPAEAVAASLGCGNPLAVADLHPGDTVLDLGSGGGIDVLLSARRVGPTGKAYGLDMTEEMLALARRNAERAGATNVEFRYGHIEDIPLPDAAVDVVISNCVINISSDKPAVFRETHRVLKPGGRFAVSDVVADDSLTAAERAECGGRLGCIAGALSRTEYREGLAAARFTDVTITPTHEVADGMHSAENTHEAAARLNADTKVVYVDNDPVVAAHGCALLAEGKNTFFATADLTRPDEVFAHDIVAAHLDLTQPAGLMQVSTLHHVSDEVDPVAVMRDYIDRLPSGSYVAITHFYDPHDGGPLSDLARKLQDIMVSGPMGSGYFRSRQDIAAMFDGLEFVDPGLALLPDWWPDGPRTTALKDVQHLILGGVGRKP